MSDRAFLGWSLAAGGLVAALVAYRRRHVEGSGADEATALARVIASEVGRGTAAERAAIGWAVRNRAARRGVSIVRLVCTPRCGPQHEDHAKLRPFSSAQVASGDDVHLAAEIVAAAKSEDPTGGAFSFIEPALQDKLAAAGKLGYRLTYAEVRARWIADGQKPLGQVGRFELWGAA
jgi:hypothetical protein